MLSSTRLRGIYSLRLCIMSHQTTWEDVRETLEAIDMSWSKGIFAAVVVIALACKGKSDGPHDEAQQTVVGYGQGGQGAADGSFGSAARVATPAPRARELSAVVAEPDEIGKGVDVNSGSDPLVVPPGFNASDAAMIIRTGTATIQVDSLEPAVVRLRMLAQSLGGYIGNTSMQTGKDQLRAATVEMKVPASRWGQLVSGLKPIGTLEAQDENAEDVTEEFVDVQARVANSRRLEERLIALLANRTGKLSDVLAVERELARVREEIDRYEGRIRFLKSRTAVSTMTVTLHEPPPVLGNQPGQNPIADAFRDAWRIFVGMIAFLISSLGVIVPIVVIGLVVWRFVLRRGRKSGDA